jgi:hypothetical protein
MLTNTDVGSVDERQEDAISFGSTLYLEGRSPDGRKLILVERIV